MSVQTVTITDCKFGVHLEADATAVAQSIADAVAELALANNMAAQVLVKLAERFATANIEHCVRIDAEGQVKP